MQMELLLKFVDNSRRSLEGFGAAGSDIRLDQTIFSGCAPGFEFRLAGVCDRVTKERFGVIALKLGRVIRQARPAFVDDHCMCWTTDDFVFYAALMDWSRCRGEAAGDVYIKSLSDPIRAAIGFVDMLEYELAVVQPETDATSDQHEPGGRDIPDDLISHVDAAETVPCSTQTIRNRIDDGTLRAYGPSRRVSKQEVLEKKPSLSKRSHYRVKNRTRARAESDKQHANSATKAK